MRPYRKIAPSLVTLGGLLGGLLGAWLLATGRPIAALCWLGLGQLCDLVDGWLARKLRAVTEFGARLDWSSDCAVAVALYVAIGCWPAVAAAAVLQALTWPGRSAAPRVSGRSAAVIFAFVFAFAAPSEPMSFALRCTVGAP